MSPELVALIRQRDTIERQIDERVRADFPPKCRVSWLQGPNNRVGTVVAVRGKVIEVLADRTGVVNMVRLADVPERIDRPCAVSVTTRAFDGAAIERLIRNNPGRFSRIASAPSPRERCPGCSRFAEFLRAAETELQLTAHGLDRMRTEYGIEDRAVAELLISAAKKAIARETIFAATKEALRVLSVLGVQTDQYRNDHDFRDAVNDGLALAVQRTEI